MTEKKYKLKRKHCLLKIINKSKCSQNFYELNSELVVGVECKSKILSISTALFENIIFMETILKEKIYFISKN